MIGARRESSVNQDILETRIPPIDAQGFGIERFLCSGVIGQNAEGLKNFLDFQPKANREISRKE